MPGTFLLNTLTKLTEVHKAHKELIQNAVNNSFFPLRVLGELCALCVMNGENSTKKAALADGLIPLVTQF